MWQGSVLGFLVGVGLTVAGYQLWVLPARHPPGLIGEAHASKPDAPAQAVAPVIPLQPRNDLAAQIRAKEAELARLRSELGRAQAAGADVEKRLEAAEGKPRAWPANLPHGYRAEVMESKLSDMLQKTKLGSLADIDCDEFPCIAVIQARPDEPDFQKKLQAAINDVISGGDWGPQVATSFWSSQKDVDGKPVQFSAIALAPADSYDDDLHTRSNHRAQSAMTNVTPR